MEKYKNKNGHAGILRYKNGKDYIQIEFADVQTYVYNYERPGSEHVEQMKKLAPTGLGLTTYINKFVKREYWKKIS